jgi:hypothetical protein
MTDQHHPITPPPELVDQWYEASVLESGIMYDEYNFANLAARWGADQELDACCEWLRKDLDAYELVGLRAVYLDHNLHNARRPNPPSLKDKALLQLDTLNADLAMHGLGCDLSQVPGCAAFNPWQAEVRIHHPRASGATL